MKADISPADRDEITAQMDPLGIGESCRDRGFIHDLALELSQKSAGFRRSLPQSLTASLADLVRSMNCYYSNFIEGHQTHPVEIEQALNNNFSHDEKQRDLQLEAKAHIHLQRWIDSGGLNARQAVTAEGICEIHRRFCEHLPDSLLWTEDPASHERIAVEPGRLRHRDVQVGRHIAISPGALPRFLARFEQFYGSLGKLESIVSAAAAHHRLLWLHPFLDGNGRVARLMSHAQLLSLLDTGALWSVARGLARNMQTYKQLLANCDLPRRNDLDGRGHLSEEALSEFTVFFLKTCLDQVNFMEGLMQPREFSTRILLWVKEEAEKRSVPANSAPILETLLYRGELPRGEVARVLGVDERQARRVVSALFARGVLRSESPRAPLRLAFPAALAHRWLPGLFPEYTG